MQILAYDPKDIIFITRKILKGWGYVSIDHSRTPNLFFKLPKGQSWSGSVPAAKDRNRELKYCTRKWTNSKIARKMKADY